jgi:hypothetical protein
MPPGSVPSDSVVSPPELLSDSCGSESLPPESAEKAWPSYSGVEEERLLLI